MGSFSVSYRCCGTAIDSGFFLAGAEGFSGGGKNEFRYYNELIIKSYGYCLQYSDSSYNIINVLDLVVQQGRDALI